MNLRELRESRDINVKKLAYDLGVSPTLIYSYENGRAEVPTGKLFAISRLLNCSIMDVYNAVAETQIAGGISDGDWPCQ